MADLSDFKRGQVVGACMAGAGVAELFGVARSTISKVMTAFLERRKNLLSKAKLWKKAKAVW